MPGVEPAAVYQTLTHVTGEAGVEFEPLQEGTMAPASPMREDVLSAIACAPEDDYPNLELIPFMASYGTDGTAFRANGTYVYGSSGTFMEPSEAFAHGLNGRGPVATFYSSLVYRARLMRRLGSE